ncbi:MAG: CPBP family intramembrane metalloprotease [Bacteroidetes bacterium]|nr:MAG: CPBP family intramembrane metalloprotease [Bacteroidota bacterium]
MTENNPIWEHPVIYFSTRMLILVGMMLMFGGVGYSVAVFTSSSLFGINFMENPALLNDFNNPALIPALKYIQVMVSVAAFILPAWYFCKAIHQTPAHYLNIKRPPTLKTAAIGVLLIFAVMPFISWLIYINGKISFPAEYRELEAGLQAAEALAAQITRVFLQADEINTLLVNVLVIALIPAISEEFLFRGVLQGFFYQVNKNKHISVWVIAIVFSAFHGQFYGFIPRVVLGAVLGYAYLFTGSLWVSIIIHFVNNAFAVICSYGPLAKQLPSFMANDYVFEAWYINTASAAAAVLLLLVLHNNHKKEAYNGE